MRIDFLRDAAGALGLVAVVRNRCENVNLMSESSQKPLNESDTPLVVSIEMGYGHLRAAWPLANELNVEVLEVDREPLARLQELLLWTRTRTAYEAICRVSQVPSFGGPLLRFLDDATSIPHLHPTRDLSRPTVATWGLDLLTQRAGLGKGMLETLQSTGRPLLTTFFAPALIAERHGYSPVYCVVTDSDINRIWAPLDSARSGIIYLAPSTRAARRLQSYGVPSERIRFTGFPLPGELLGGPELPILKRNLARRLVRLDPQRSFEVRYGEEVERLIGQRPKAEVGKPPLITFAVGGAGAQTEIVQRFLPGLCRALEDNRLRLALVAGVRKEVAQRFEGWLRVNRMDRLLGGPIQILLEPRLRDYFRAFNALMAETDVLWTKPSEMTFFGALGLPLVLSPPVGAHERYNLRWAVEQGGGLAQRDPRCAGEWLLEWLADGTLAGAAWGGYKALPKHGLYNILREVGARSVADRETTAKAPS